MNPLADRVATRSARCPRCGNAFDCGMQAQPAVPCWCKSMPPLPANRLQPGSRCLCPECLAAEIAKLQAAGEFGAGPR